MNQAILRHRRLLGRSTLLVLGVAGATVLASGCGSDATSGSASSASRPASSESAAPADNGGGEAAPTRFVSSRFHYRVDAPGAMTEATDGSATATRGTEKLVISVVTGAQAADPAGYARTDVATLRAQSPAYKEVIPVGPVSLAGRTVQKAAYSWTNGNNAVTGNPQQLVTAVYYIPRDGSTMAVVSYSIAANQYDPQGADDVVSTFQWQ
ncbi:MAG: hypothetical protein JF887_01375 [Candidatus Dormibacteraeota bacterium]|uniref:Lipoprotein LpqN n=1 Tax=Candidatus Amunia macphersoniae TaxID=3127014 RepID=A0A934KCZ8_9BACT|nr:hypothetical protein [Candidatus Dormibacteraeota bacterium]